MKKLVLFGAGKIGRSFVAQLFSQAGWEVMFIDLQEGIVQEINKKGKYQVIIRSAKDTVLEVKHVRALLLTEKEAVTREIMEADLLAVTVGQNGLGAAMEAIAAGLIARYNKDPECKTDIIIAENIKNAAEYFKEELYSFLPVNYPLNQLVGLVETCIEKMVPLMSDEEIGQDPLRVYAESFNTLVLDGIAFKNLRPEVPGLSYVENIRAWIDRKSFIHNLGHAATAYLGYLYNPALKYTWEVLEIKTLYDEIRLTMMQAALILEHMYPAEFNMPGLEEYIDSLLLRFRNRFLGDTLYRVGCDLFRKLGPSERISGTIRSGLELGFPVDKILFVLVAGIYFRATSEEGNLLGSDELFHRRYQHRLEPILREVCGFDEEIFGSLYRKARDFNMQIQGLA